MPSKSDKQRKFMRAAANNPKFAKKAGIPQSVAREYAEADKMKDKMMYAKGGKTRGFKPCSSCPDVGACAKAGRCMLKSKGMKSGGKVRGCGTAKKGTRPAKMM